MMKIQTPAIRFVAGAALALSLAAAQASPSGTYYMTIPGAARIDAVGGGVLGSTAMAHPGEEGPVAVWGQTLRTAGIKENASGAEYAGVPGVTLAATAAGYLNGDSSVYVTDGTSDGQWNYAVDFFSGAVYRFDSQWGSPTVLFSLGTGGFEGITYDPSNQSLWLGNFSSGDLVNVALDGSPLGGFSTGLELTLTALAMDRDGTLWLADADGSGDIEHYATSGNHLGTEHYDGLGDALGGEIALPEPATLALWLAGWAGIRLSRRARLGFFQPPPLSGR